jgi:hypothetical protein
MERLREQISEICRSSVRFEDQYFQSISHSQYVRIFPSFLQNYQDPLCSRGWRWRDTVVQDGRDISWWTSQRSISSRFCHENAEVGFFLIDNRWSLYLPSSSQCCIFPGRAWRYFWGRWRLYRGGRANQRRFAWDFSFVSLVLSKFNRSDWNSFWQVQKECISLSTCRRAQRQLEVMTACPFALVLRTVRSIWRPARWSYMFPHASVFRYAKTKGKMFWS